MENKVKPTLSETCAVLWLEGKSSRYGISVISNFKELVELF